MKPSRLGLHSTWGVWYCRDETFFWQTTKPWLQISWLPIRWDPPLVWSPSGVPSSHHLQPRRTFLRVGLLQLPKLLPFLLVTWPSIPSLPNWDWENSKISCCYPRLRTIKQHFWRYSKQQISKIDASRGKLVTTFVAEEYRTIRSDAVQNRSLKTHKPKRLVTQLPTEMGNLWPFRSWRTTTSILFDPRPCRLGLIWVGSATTPGGSQGPTPIFYRNNIDSFPLFA